ncbi:MAG: hypothetical protein SFY80_15200 [Verrucomicrobiota bacterium]|nr:hypothetical protein [Verrucomicrobiota bacterium]
MLTATDKRWNYTRYDAMGRVEFTKDPEGEVTRQTYAGKQQSVTMDVGGKNLYKSTTRNRQPSGPDCIYRR